MGFTGFWRNVALDDPVGQTIRSIGRRHRDRGVVETRLVSDAELAVEDNLGGYIGRGRTDGAPFWLLYVLGTIFSLFGIVLAIGCFAMLQSQLPMEVQGGRIGVGVGLVLLLFGGLMLYSGYAKSHADRIELFENGIRVVGGVFNGAWHFDQLSALRIVVIQPGSWLSFQRIKSLCLLVLRMVEIRTIDGVIVTSADDLFGGGYVCVSVNGSKEVEARSPGLSRLLRFSEAATNARPDCDVKLIQL